MSPNDVFSIKHLGPLAAFVNLTPHNIVVRDVEGTKEHVIPPCGLVARCAVNYMPLGKRNNVRLRQQTFGPVEGLPAPKPGVTYIVSALVLERIKADGQSRADVVAPDTGPDAVRVNGQVVAVYGFVC